MSKRSDYPLFNHWFKTLNWLIDLGERLPKHLRFSLAQRILQHSLDIIELITEAIYEKERLLLLKQINRHLEILRILIRICHHRRHLSIKQYQYINEQIDIAGRMVGGWIKTL